jgi:hypothetical protein
MQFNFNVVAEMGATKTIRRNPKSVAQIFNLLYRRIAFCQAFQRSCGVLCLKPSRLQIGDTAD